MSEEKTKRTGDELALVTRVISAVFFINDTGSGSKLKDVIATESAKGRDQPILGFVQGHGCRPRQKNADNESLRGIPIECTIATDVDYT